MNVYEVITARILESLEKGVVPWRMPWRSTTPMNMVSKKAYRGVNVFLLSCGGYTSPYWLTFKQAKAKGGSVRKGEKATPCIFYSKIEDKKAAPAANGKSKTFGMLRYYQVFNVAQCDGIEIPVTDVVKEFNPIAECERIVSGWDKKPMIEHGGNRACYSPSADRISMPPQGAFGTPEEYYSTLFHEMTHSTGHLNRLNRKGITDAILFGSHNYSFEELVAECGAAFLCGNAGIVNATIDNSVAYIANWASKLKSDPKWIVDAAAQASRAAEHIMGPGAEEADQEGEEG